MRLGKVVGLGPGYIVFDRDLAPHSSPSTLSAHAYCGQTVAHLSNCSALVCLSCPVLLVTLVHCGQRVRWIKMKLGMRVGLGPGRIVLDGDRAPPSPKGHSPQFSAHICCDQRAAWIKMPLGMEVGIGPGDFVLDGDAAPLPRKGRSPQIFGACLLWPNGWMDQDATWYGGKPLPRRRCVRWGRSSP